MKFLLPLLPWKKYNLILEGSVQHVGYTTRYLGILYNVTLYRSNQTLPRAFH